MLKTIGTGLPSRSSLLEPYSLHGPPGRSGRELDEPSRLPDAALRPVNSLYMRYLHDLRVCQPCTRCASRDLRRELPATCKAIGCNFSGSVANSFLCVRSKVKVATRAAHELTTYHDLSAEWRHKLRHVVHRVGGAEHLWKRRQSLHGEQEGARCVSIMDMNV